MRSLLPLLLAVLIVAAPITFAEDGPANPNDIPGLIKQLGDDSPKVREAASEQLRRLGDAALPALTEAQKSEDPEVVNRAQTIARQIGEDRQRGRATRTEPVSPFGLPGGVGGGGGGNFAGGGIGRIQVNGGGGVSKTVSVSRAADGSVTRVTTVKEDGQRVTIREGGDGITVTTTKIVDGKDVEETVRAKDKEELKKEHPETFDLFERHTRQTVRVRGGVAGGVEIGRLDDAERGQIEAAVRQSRKLMEEELRRAGAAAGVDPRGQVELEHALNQARATAAEHRRLVEEQFRTARQQLEELRREQLKELEDLRRQREQRIEESRVRRVD